MSGFTGVFPHVARCLMSAGCCRGQQGYLLFWFAEMMPGASDYQLIVSI